MGVVTPNSNEKKFKKRAYYSLCNTYPEHKDGKAADKDNSPVVGACFQQKVYRKTVTGETENHTNYLFNYNNPKNTSGFSVYGFLKDITLYDTNFGQELHIVLDDKSEQAILKFKVFGGDKYDEVNYQCYEIVKTFLSAQKYGFIIASPWLSKRPALKNLGKYVSKADLTKKGIELGNPQTWKKHYPKAQEVEQCTPRVTFYNIVDMDVQTFESNLTNWDASKQMKANGKMGTIEHTLPAEIVENERGEEIHNKKNRMASYAALIDELIAKFKAQYSDSNNPYADMNTEEQPAYTSTAPKDNYEEETASPTPAKQASQASKEADVDDLPF